MDLSKRFFPSVKPPKFFRRLPPTKIARGAKIQAHSGGGTPTTEFAIVNCICGRSPQRRTLFRKEIRPPQSWPQERERFFPSVKPPKLFRRLPPTKIASGQNSQAISGGGTPTTEFAIVNCIYWRSYQTSTLLRKEIRPPQGWNQERKRFFLQLRPISFSGS